MDSCFALIGAHQHGIAVGWMNGKNPRVSKTLYCWDEGKGWRVFNTRGFSHLCMTCELSPSRKKKGKKDGWITRKVLRVVPPMGPLIWLLTGGDGSFLADLKACLTCDSGCITQKGLIRNLIYVTAFNWNQIYRNWQNWLLSIYNQIRWKQDDVQRT